MNVVQAAVVIPLALLLPPLLRLLLRLRRFCLVAESLQQRLGVCSSVMCASHAGSSRPQRLMTAAAACEAAAHRGEPLFGGVGWRLLLMRRRRLLLALISRERCH